MTKWKISDTAANVRLDVWLARQPEVGSRGRAAEWIARGKIFLNGEAVDAAQAGRKLEAGDTIGLWIDRPGSSSPVDHAIHDARSRLRILHEDEAIVVVDKPPGLIVEPLPGRRDAEVTLLHLVEDHGRHQVRSRFYVVHRIDRDTSGLVLFAKTAAARDHLKAQFESRSPVRVYQAVLCGHVTPRTGTWRDLLAWDSERLVQRRAHVKEEKAKEAIALYKVAEQFDDAALVEVSLVTGKRNQIRVQAGLRGHPLIGERQYRFGAPAEPPGAPSLDRQALHAWRLEFVHPATLRRARFSAALPEDMRRLLDAFRARA